MERGPIRTELVILVVVGFALRVGYCAYGYGLGSTPEVKYREYVVTGQRLLESGTIESPLVLGQVDGRPSGVLPPLYVTLVAGCYWLLGVESFAATIFLQVLNAVATSLAVLFVFLVARQLGGELAGWVAALLATVNPTLIYYTGLIWDTDVFVLGVSAAMWLMLRLSDRAINWRRCFGFGLFLGLLALLNPALTVAYPFLALWMLSRSGGWSAGGMARGVAMVVVGWLAAIAPWTARNYAHFNELMYVRNGLGLELWLGVCPEADARPDSVYRQWFPRDNREAQASLVQLGEQVYIKQCGRRALAAIQADPWRWVRLSAARTSDFWAGTLLTHTPRGESSWPRSRLRAAALVFVCAEVGLILSALLVQRRLTNGAGWMLAVVISFSIAYCITHVQLRYRAPVEPVMAVLVAVAVTASGHPRQRSEMHPQD